MMSGYKSEDDDYSTASSVFDVPLSGTNDSRGVFSWAQAVLPEPPEPSEGVDLPQKLRYVVISGGTGCNSLCGAPFLSRLLVVSR